MSEQLCGATYYDGVLQGAGATPTDVKQLIADSLSDTVIEVSPDFTASDQYNQYPTITQGLARATALLPTLALVRVSPATYKEDIVLTNHYIEFLTGAVLAGADTAGTNAVTVTGAGSASWIKGLFTQTAKSPTPYQKLNVLKVDSNAFLILENSKNFVNFDDYSNYNLFLDNDAGIIALNCLWYWKTAGAKLVGMSGEPLGAALQLRNFSGCTFFNFNTPAVELLTGNLTAQSSLPATFANCAITALIPSNGVITFRQYTRAGLPNTIVEERYINLPDLTDARDHLVNRLEATAMWQDIFPPAPDPDGTMREGLLEIDNWQQTRQTQIDDNTMNIARLIADSNLDEPWNGVLNENYIDDTDIDAAKSHNYKHDDDCACVEIADFNDIDDFEGGLTSCPK